MHGFLSQIIVSNKSSIPKAEIVKVTDAGQLGYMESMQEWVLSGRNKEDWNRAFSVIKITDATKEQLAYLESYLPDERREWYFSSPAEGSDFYISLLNEGEVIGTLSQLEPFLIRRS